MENNEATLRAGVISTSEATIMGVAGAAPVMCIGGSLGSIIGLTGGAGASLSVAFATLLCVFIGLSYGDLSGKYNCCGGTYSYIAHVFGIKAGLWSAFVYYGVMFTTSACPPAIFATYLEALAGIPGYIGWAIFVVICATVTWFGIGLSTKATVVVFLVEMVLMLIPCFKILSLTPEEFVFATSINNAMGVGTEGFAGILLAVLVWVWAYVGMEAPSFMGEEMKDGAKGVKIAIPLSALITGLLYVICCWLWTANMAPYFDTLAWNGDILAAYCALFGYAAGETMVCISVMVAAVACGLAFYSMMPRFLYDQARKGLLPKGVAKLNKHQIPHVGMIIYIISSGIFCMYGLYAYSEGGFPFNGINDHFTIMGITATTAYAFICLANVKERWHDHSAGGIFFGKIIPILTALVIFYIIFFTSGTKYVVITLVWYVLALILAFLLQKRVTLEELAE